MEQQPKAHKFVVRLPLDLQADIKHAATHYRRSMNSEIVARLEQSFSGIPSAAQEQEHAPYLHAQMENLFVRTLSSEEEELVRAYRRLTPSQQQALLELLN